MIDSDMNPSKHLKAILQQPQWRRQSSESVIIITEIIIVMKDRMTAVPAEISRELYLSTEEKAANVLMRGRGSL